MAANLQDLQAQDDAYAKQVAVQGAQKEPSEQQPSLVNVGTQDRGHVTSSIIDSVMNEVGQWGTAAQHVGQDVMAGAATAAANTMDAIKSNGPADPKDSANLPTPVWDHAHEAITDFRDAMVVQDPTGVDPVIQAGAQLAIPFAAYSKALNALHGISNIVAAGVATDTTALAPHDMRTADLIRLGRSTDTKIGAALRAIGPYGLNAYVDYLADRTNETEAQGRFKNALDGLGANLILTPLIHAAGIVVKQGTAAAQYAVQNGIRNTISDLAPQIKVGPAAERGSVGVPPAARPTAGITSGGQDRMSRIMELLRQQERAAAGAKEGEITHAVNGEIHTVTSDNGTTVARRIGNDLHVIDTETAKDARGKGEATARMGRLVQESPSGTVHSDKQVSAPAQKVYDRLDRSKFDVKENPNTLDAGTGEKMSASELKGVYQVRLKGKAHS